MGRGINIEFIEALEQGRLGEKNSPPQSSSDLVAERVQHSYPKPLGDIFHWNIVLKSSFDRLEKGPYNIERMIS